MDAHTWWQRAVFYQVYPRSFADQNGDGIGDLPGITTRLDYLRDLGIDAIWLSPHYPSPFLDCGYDISDYTAVSPDYGSLTDFVTFLHEAHARDIRVVLDLVLNHTADQHPWFQASRARRDDPRRDWYIWRDGRNGGPPNNWVSIFGGSAWTFDPATGQYYYHAFLAEQPDLNWRNPAVKGAMWDVVRFWLDLGVDGFRLDAITTIFEHPDLPNHTLSLPPSDLINVNGLSREDYQQLMCFQVRQPGLHALLRELRTLVDQYPGDRVLVGEDQEDEPRSLLHFYRRMLRLRRTTPALLAGDYHALHPHSDAYLAFLRQDAATGQTCLVVLNFSDTAQTVVFDLRSTQPRLLFSSQARADKPLALAWLPVAPFEICIIEVA